MGNDIESEKDKPGFFDEIDLEREKVTIRGKYSNANR